MFPARSVLAHTVLKTVSQERLQLYSEADGRVTPMVPHLVSLPSWGNEVTRVREPEWPLIVFFRSFQQEARGFRMEDIGGLARATVTFTCGGPRRKVPSSSEWLQLALPLVLRAYDSRNILWFITEWKHSII